MKSIATTFVLGLMFGVALSRIGFSSWDEVHAMFTFADLRLVLTFGLAVVLIAVAWKLLAGRTQAKFGRRVIHPGTIPGALLFGVGWALSGACPSIALVQIGEGQFGAIWTVGGIFLGNWLYGVVHRRFFRWDPGVCGE